MLIHIPVSAGELIDKITILRVKADRIGAAKKPNVVRELRLLEAVMEEALPPSPELAALAGRLAEVNARLWDIEEGKRDCRAGRVRAHFLDLARAVYLENDRRAAIKREINPGRTPPTRDEWLLRNFHGIMEYLEGELQMTREELAQELEIWRSWTTTRVPPFFPGFLELLADYRRGGGLVAVHLSLRGVRHRGALPCGRRSPVRTGSHLRVGA